METMLTIVCDSKLLSPVVSNLIVERTLAFTMLPFLAWCSISCKSELKTYKVQVSVES